MSAGYMLYVFPLKRKCPNSCRQCRGRDMIVVVDRLKIVGTVNVDNKENDRFVVP